MREKLIDVFMHIGDHITYRDEYGLCFDTPLVEAIEDVLAMLKSGVTIHEWIPVTERLPEDDTRVLVYLRDGYGENEMIDTDRLRNGRWARWNKFISHWMPISISAPQEGE